jgi:hypothetical protein
MLTAETFAEKHAVTLDEAVRRLELLYDFGFLRHVGVDIEGSILYSPSFRLLRSRWRYN